MGEQPALGPFFCPPSAERELETRRDANDTELSAVRPMPRLAPTAVDNRLAEWRRLVRGNTTQVRAVLQRVLNGRIVFTPSGQGYTFAAPTQFEVGQRDRCAAPCVYRAEHPRVGTPDR